MKPRHPRSDSIMDEKLANSVSIDSRQHPGRVPGALSIRLAGESITLLPQRALWWPARGSVFIADTHFGKTATFRSHGIPIGDESLEADLRRLSELIDQTAADRLVILGDLLHARQGRSPATLERVTAWRGTHAALSIDLVRGNHDRAAGAPLDDWKMRVVPDGTHEAPFVFRHHPEATPDGYVLAGHLHPKVVLPLEAGGQVKLPCFWVRAGVAILPAFGSFIDSAAVQPLAGETTYAVGDGAVHDVTALMDPARPTLRKTTRRRRRRSV